MEWLKNTTVPILLLAGGLAVFGFGLADSVDINGFKATPPNGLPRVLLIVLGLILIGIGVLLEWRAISRERASRKDSGAPSASASVGGSTNQLELAHEEDAQTQPSVAEQTSSIPEIRIGLRVGRRSITCGALLVRECDPGILSAAQDWEVVSGPETTTFAPGTPYSEILSIAGDLIEKTANEAVARAPGAPICAIGFGVPGLVDPRARRVDKSVRGLHGLEELSSEVARDLAKRSQLLRLLDVHDVSGIEALSHIDNDVRCAARATLSRHANDRQADPSWNNFAILHLGTGVGLSIVTRGQIYYGARGWAGEIGHIDLEVGADGFESLGEDGLLPQPCSCSDEHVYHFETLVNYRGIKALAEAIDKESYSEVIAAIHAADAQISEDEICREVWPTLIAHQEIMQTPVSELRGIQITQELDSYLGLLQRTYIEILASGIACVLNLFDVDKLVLFGSLYEQMRRDFFNKALTQSVQRRLPTPRHVPIIHSHVADTVWLGAALASRDPSFEAFRNDQQA